MVMKTNEIFIPIPKARNTQPQITVNGDDVTGRVIESEWIKPLMSLGIGSFRCKLSNAHGQISDKYIKGQEVICILDNSDKTRVQFKGRIDYPSEVIERQGQYVELVGRHKAYFLSERKVCHRTTGDDCVDILKAILDKEAPEIDQTDLPASSGVTTDVEWEYKPFPECVAELMEKSVHDSYVDNDLKIKFFPANSILNENEAIAENDNFRETKEFGKDDYYERTEVTVVGQDDVGLPIIYTAKSGIDDDEDPEEREPEGVREIFHKETAANTMDKVQKLAQAILSGHTNRAAQAVFHTLGLETLEPGENLWVSVPRQKIYSPYKAVQITHLFGMKTGGWRTETQTENNINTTNTLINYNLSKTHSTTQIKNVNKLKYSFNIPFDDSTYTSSNTRTTEDDGVLKLTSESYNDGEWISTAKVAPKNVLRLELLVVGKDITNTIFYYSLNNGSTWTQMTKNTLITPVQVGKNIKIKAKLVRSVLSPSPEIHSLALLFDFE